MTDRRRARETPRILYVENVGWGFLTHRVAFALAARAAGYDVHVATDLEHDSERDRIEALGFTFHRLSLARGVAGPGRELRTMWDLAALYRSLRPDIVHQITIKPVIYGTFVARFVPSIAVVNTVSGLGHLYVNDDRRSRLLRGFSNLGYRSAFARGKSRTIFQNADDLARFPGVVRPLVIEGAGVDLTAFAPSEEPPGEITVVLPARMLREKGVIEFAEAARSLRAAGVHARFQLAGIPDPANPGSLTERDLERLERDCGVEWLGYQVDMAAVFRSCHIVCLPSAYGEGIPKALLEAAGCARPIVTTDMPGCRHVVTHGRNGLLVPPRDTHALANALRLLIDDKALRARLGEQGRAIAEARFDVKRVTAETLTVYAGLLEKSYFSATTAAM